MQASAAFVKKRVGELKEKKLIKSDSSQMPRKKVIKKVRTEPSSNQAKPSMNGHSKQTASVKREAMVTELACRWNYALPSYPPKNFNFESALSKEGFKLVDTANFARLKTDSGEKIVTGVDYFEGLFRDKLGKCHDLRPHNVQNLDNYLDSKLKG